MTDQRADFRQGDAQALALETASRDAVVSALTLNFVPDRAKALSEMKRVARPGATVAFYVWDYPGGGLEFLRTFWTHAAVLDPRGVELAEARRFPFCTPVWADRAGARGRSLRTRPATPLDTPTVFSGLRRLLAAVHDGRGPAPGYVASLAPDARERLKDRLEASLPRSADGSIALKARAWAVRAKAGVTVTSAVSVELARSWQTSSGQARTRPRSRCRRLDDRHIAGSGGTAAPGWDATCSRSRRHIPIPLCPLRRRRGR